MARYTPGNVPLDPAQLSAFVREELEKIAVATGTQDQTLSLDTLYAYPPKFREGTIFKADGVSFARQRFGVTVGATMFDDVGHLGKCVLE